MDRPLDDFIRSQKSQTPQVKSTQLGPADGTYVQMSPIESALDMELHFLYEMSIEDGRQTL